VVCTLIIETEGHSERWVQWYASVQAAAERVGAGRQFALEDELRINGHLSIGIEQHDNVAIVRRAHQSLDVWNLMTGILAKRYFDERTAEAETGVG